MFKLIIAIYAAIIISGCAVTPEPFTMNDLKSAKAERLSALTKDQEPVTQAISLYEAMARAIKYNLDYKVELFEEALRVGEADLASLEMLPKLVASAGWNGRDSYNGSSSSTLLSGGGIGDVSDSVSISSERDVTDASLKFSWDILDFGLSYVRAKQSTDQVLIANERKRKVISRVIANVRTAFWRAASAQRLVMRLRSFEANIETALSASEETFNSRRTAPMVALTYQRELLEIQQQLQVMESEMSLAKMQLAALMNLSPASAYTLQVPERDKLLPQSELNPEALVDIALQMRPELRELSYEQRINRRQAQSALLEVLPNLSLFGGSIYNSNDYLYSNNWVNWGAQASWNVFNAFKYPHKKRAIELNSEFLDQRALALTMAVITQVHVGSSKYDRAKQKLKTMKRFHTVNNSIMEQIGAGYKLRKVSYQTYVRETMSNIVSEAKYDIAYAELQNSYADVIASLGQDIFGNVNTDRVSVAKLADHLKMQWELLGSAIERAENQQL